MMVQRVVRNTVLFEDSDNTIIFENDDFNNDTVNIILRVLLPENKSQFNVRTRRYI